MASIQSFRPFTTHQVNAFVARSTTFDTMEELLLASPTPEAFDGMPALLVDFYQAAIAAELEAA